LQFDVKAISAIVEYWSTAATTFCSNLDAFDAAGESSWRAADGDLQLPFIAGIIYCTNISKKIAGPICCK